MHQKICSYKSYFSNIEIVPGKSYVYVYFDPDTLDPFYVGKGVGSRYRRHIVEARKPKTETSYNTAKDNRIRKILESGKMPTIVKIVENISNDCASLIEIALISGIGKRIAGTGPLLNISDGGDGATGAKKSEKVRKIMSEKSKPEYKGYAYHNPETGEILYCKEDSVPDGFIRGSGVSNKHTKGTFFYHDPETKEQKRFQLNCQPEGWLKGRASFKNSFAGANLKKHIITGETSYVIDPDPLYVSPRCKGIYVYTDLNGIKKITGTLGKLLLDLNLDFGTFNTSLKNENQVVTSRTITNGLSKTHKGMRIVDVYEIKYYPKETLTSDLCQMLLSDRLWVNLR